MAAGARNPARLLLVEGKDDSAIVQSLCALHAMPEIFRVKQYGGKDPLLAAAPLEIRAEGRERVGIVIDADGDASARWQQVRAIIVKEGYDPLPKTLPADGLVHDHPSRARVGVWIMPDNASSGMLEDFAASLIPPGDALWAYASTSLDGIAAEHRRFAHVHRSKAHMHTWLAWQESPGAPMGLAISQKALDGRAENAARFVTWLRRLFVDD